MKLIKNHVEFYTYILNNCLLIKLFYYFIHLKNILLTTKCISDISDIRLPGQLILKCDAVYGSGKL